jgi:hypothetical protein
MKPAERYTFRQVLRQVRGAQSSLQRAETRYYKRGDQLLDASIARCRKALANLERETCAAIARVRGEPGRKARAA